jgi:hypothetical protein
MRAEGPVSRLAFAIEYRGVPPRANELPVEVRRANLSVVKRCTSCDTIEIPPGKYFVSARLPSGQELETTVQVEEGAGDTTAILRVESASPHEWLADYHHLVELREPGKSRGSVDAVRTSKSMDPNLMHFVTAQEALRQGRLKLRVSGGAVPVRESSHLKPTAQGGVDLGSQDRDALEFRISIPSPLGFIVVTAETAASDVTHTVLVPGGASRVIVHVEEGGVAIDPELEQPGAEIVLRYVDRGDSASAAILAERLLQGKVSDPISAAVGAYALLRFGEIDRLHDWTENLFNWSQWLPDGAAILGEHLARLGEHEAALERLLAIGERGVPIFREGVSLTLDRLRVYASVKKGLSPGSSAKARRLLEELEVITKTLDPLEPFTTLRGVDVRDVAPFPSDAPEPHDKEQPQ